MEKIRIRLNNHALYCDKDVVEMVLTTEQIKLLDYLLANEYFEGDYEILTVNDIIDLTE